MYTCFSGGLEVGIYVFQRRIRGWHIRVSASINPFNHGVLWINLALAVLSGSLKPAVQCSGILLKKGFEAVSIPLGLFLCRKRGLVGYSMGWRRAGEMTGGEGERISTPLAVA